jgi:hypothetical protein
MTKTGLLSCAAPGLAQGLDGQYQVGGCTDQLSDGRMSISGTSMRYWETSCELSNPVTIRDMAGATLFDAACWSEGIPSEERILLMPGGAMRMPGVDLILLREGQVVLYQRCD